MNAISDFWEIESNQTAIWEFDLGVPLLCNCIFKMGPIWECSTNDLFSDRIQEQFSQTEMTSNEC